MRVTLILVVVCLLGACGGGSGGKSNGGKTSSSMSSVSSSVGPVAPSVPDSIKELGEEEVVNFFLSNDAIDFEALTPEKVEEYNNQDLTSAFEFYHEFSKPKDLITQMANLDFDGNALFPFEIKIGEDVSYLVIQRLKTGQDEMKLVISSWNFMDDQVDKGEFCYLPSFNTDVNAAFNEQSFQLFNGDNVVGTELTYIPFYDSADLEAMDIPAQPRLRAVVGQKTIDFLLSNKDAPEYPEGLIITGILIDGVLETADVSDLIFPNNGFKKLIYDDEANLAVNFRTTYYEYGSDDAIKTSDIPKCISEPIDRAGITLDSLFESVYTSEDVQYKAYMHIASDGVVSVFSEDSKTLNNCYLKGSDSAVNAGLQGREVTYNRDGNYLLISVDGRWFVRFHLDEDKIVENVSIANAWGEVLSGPDTELNYENFAVSSLLSTLSLSDLNAGACQ